MTRPVILCAGGDMRSSYTAENLCKLGEVYTVGIVGSAGGSIKLDDCNEMSHKADLLALPMLSGKNLDIETSDGKHLSCVELSRCLNRNSLVVGGRLSTQVIEYFSSLGHDVADYFTREELVIRNCIPTAEGALQIAMQELAVTVSGSSVLVIGYGRVAKACARLFGAAGAKVTVCARAISQLAQAQNDGCDAVRLSDITKCIGGSDVIINTVPALILTKETLKMVGKKSIIIDLASKPGGTDFESAKQLNVRAVHALALPGKVAPVTSGKLIAEAIRNIYFERRETDVFTRH